MDDAQLPGDAEHLAVEELLPWYVTGALDADDAVRVDIHLGDCNACRLLLLEEEGLREAVAALPIGGRASAPEVFPASPVPYLRRGRVGSGRKWRSPVADRTRWFGNAKRLVAAQAVILVVAVGLMLPGLQMTGDYRGLGSKPTPSAGNAIVMFRPEATELQMRTAFEVSGAQIVDGPTEAHAYVLRVADHDRARRLTVLRRQPNVVMAESIDGPALQ